MPASSSPSTTLSPPTSSTSPEDAIAYYKAQYEQLEAELADFQISSRDLELELERDVEESEKREQKLKAKVEAAEYEIDEWKVKKKFKTHPFVFFVVYFLLKYIEQKNANHPWILIRRNTKNQKQKLQRFNQPCRKKSLPSATQLVLYSLNSEISKSLTMHSNVKHETPLPPSKTWNLNTTSP